MPAKGDPSGAPTPEQEAALAAITRLLDENDADVQIRWDHWPHHDAPESVAADERMKARAGPDGAFEQALEALRLAYGGTLPKEVSDGLTAEIKRRGFAHKGGWLIEQAWYGTGPLADACRALFAGLPRPEDAR